MMQQLSAEGVSAKGCNIVAFVHLAKKEAEAVIMAHQHVAGSRFVGVRMILNYSADDPSLTWPNVEKNYLTGDEAFKEG